MPLEGQVCQCPGKWKNELLFGVIEKVGVGRLPEEQSVDVRYLKPWQGRLFEIDQSRKRAWFKMSEIKLVNSRRLPEGVYFVEDETNSLGNVSLENSTATDGKHMKEYNSLKRNWLHQLVVLDMLGFSLLSLVSVRLALDFILGSTFGFVYLRLLMDSVDNLGKHSYNFLHSTLASTRILIPFAAIGTQIILTRSSNIEFTENMSSFTIWNLIATMTGFSSYRLPVLFSTSGMLFSSVQNVTKSIQTSEKRDLSTESAERPPSCIVLAGPSGVGKSTFIRKLLHDYPDIFGFSISHTTRLPRENEEDGISYYFISKERFLEDIANGKFIEYAQVHGNFYGTSFDSVKNVIDNKKICLLDLDIQGVKAVKKSLLRATFIWIAAPSMEALESRLRKRKSESEESIQRRLCTAKEEILFALRSGIFDYTVMNDDIDRAYEDLKSLLRPYISSGMNF
ncbi:hypothetical protein GpartN1_g341.t1 [Galdieria partita]|uniref:guanylate kinase n=1 Tax=Galdieria partita TaxID=83374 RepID=A0A9C7PQF9_9RHOD|nr:hypothetical protein GpartN1_g341.t1 [Galdieria partita]